MDRFLGQDHPNPSVICQVKGHNQVVANRVTCLHWRMKSKGNTSNPGDKTSPFDCTEYTHLWCLETAADLLPVECPGDVLHGGI